MKNKDIRAEVKKAQLHLWQIADELGMTDSQFSKYLRYELPENEKERIRNIIKELQK